MHDELALVTTIAAAFGLALLCGLAAAHMRLPPLVGYLVAGIILSPATPGFVADVALARELAEIGVMLLMFGVGLHLSMRDLLSVRRIALPGALVQIAAATGMGAAAASWWGWNPGAALIFGLSLSVASTVVLLKALETLGLLETINGRIAVGWLVVEDMAMVLALVLLSAVAGLLSGADAGAARDGGELARAVALTVAKVGAFIALMLVAGRRVLPWLLWMVARTASRELFTLCVVAVALGVAFGAARLFDVSFALGAFFAGMMMRESQFSHRAANDSLPLRDAFAVLFFVSVGMLFDPLVIVEQPGRLLLVTLIVLVGKTVAAVLLVLALRYPLGTALTVGASLAQIGEFSFILAGLGVGLGLLPREGQSLILAVALLSIALNPLMFAAVRPLRAWALDRSALARRLDNRSDPLGELPADTARQHLSGQVVLVGYGRVGKRIARAVVAQGTSLIVVENNRELVQRLRDEGFKAVYGDVADPVVLVQAHVATAAMLVLATPDPLGVRKAVDTARTLNPEIKLVVRTHSDEEAELLRRDGIAEVFMGEHELALGMTRHVLAVLDHAAADAPARVPAHA
jgi:CPA2 family monovalent cation:H+ antiporter-2